MYGPCRVINGLLQREEFRMRIVLSAALIAIVSAVLAAPARAAEDWPNWRGPAFNGASEASGLPGTWSTTENVLWSAPLPGASASTPAIVKDRVYVTAVDDRTRELVALAFDRKTGKEAWRHVAGMNTRTWKLNPGLENNMASCSPAADGERAVFLFATGDLLAFAPDGKPLWARNLVKDHGAFVHLWGYGASPVLHKGKLYVPILRRDQPYDGTPVTPPLDSLLLLIDAKTGKDLVRHVRPTEAKEESKDAYGTPVVREDGGRPEILLLGGDCVTGHDPDTGKELWRWGEWNPSRIGQWRIIPTPLAAEGLVFVGTPKKGPFFAVKPAGTGGTIAWQTKEVTPDVCTPLYYRKRLYVLDGDRKLLVGYDPKTGEKKGSVTPPGREVFRASPTAADGKIFCINEDGTVSVLAPDDLRILATVEMGERPCRASVALAGTQIVIRTAKAVYCIGKP
jgi:outer membrane protein assembly factor BamB